MCMCVYRYMHFAEGYTLKGQCTFIPSHFIYMQEHPK